VQLSEEQQQHRPISPFLAILMMILRAILVRLAFSFSCIVRKAIGFTMVGNTEVQFPSFGDGFVFPLAGVGQ